MNKWRKTGKRLVAALLAVMLVLQLLPVAPGTGQKAYAAEQTEVTRIEWIRELVSLFDMQVEEDNYPDNYFSDITEESEYYRDVMVAAEFGVLDIEAGEPVCPDDPVTREFAAHTMNFCLGFQLEENAEYTFTDVEDTAYPADAQMAVNRGWFQLSGGMFLPAQSITAEEKDAMLADAETVLASTAIEEGYENTYTFADGTIVIPNGTEVLIDENQTVAITDCPETITEGAVFAVWLNDIPVTYTAKTVSTEGNITYIATTEAESGEVVENIDAQGVVDGDLAQAYAADEDTTISYIAGGTQERAFSDGTAYSSPRLAGSVPLKAVRFTKTINLSAGTKMTLTCTLSGLSVNYKINSKTHEVYVACSGDAILAATGSWDGLESAGLPKSVTLGYIPVAGVGAVTIKAEYSLTGTVTATYTADFEAGVQYTDAGGFRLVKNFQKEQFTACAEVKFQAGMAVSLGVDKIPCVNASVYAKIGAISKVNTNWYNDGKQPDVCTTYAAWLYAKVGASLSLDYFIGKKSFSKELEIYNLSNSPVRIVYHWEDGVLVGKCTRDTSKNWYLTAFGSQYGSLPSGYGLDSEGNYVPVYTYTLIEEEDGTQTAKVTGYTGRTSALMIPSEIDGYKVTVIGDGAFADRPELSIVIIPDTVVTIEADAFADCSNLCSVQMPDSVNLLGNGAFKNCISLTSMYIPKNVETDGMAGCNDYFAGPFYGCSALEEIQFAEGTTVIHDGLLHGTGLKSIEIPDTVVTLEGGYGVFHNCVNLEKVVLSEKLTTIGERTFDGCSALREILLPDSVDLLGNGAFKNCISLTSMYIPKNVETDGMAGCNDYYAGPFYGCSALEEIQFAEGTTVIHDGLLHGTGLKSIEIPDTVVTLEGGYGVFHNCVNLEKVVLRENLTTIGESTFDGCSALKEIRLPDSVDFLGNGAFKNCISLTSMYIPKDVETDGFAGCNDYYAGPFYGCSALEEIQFAEGTTVIHNGLFHGCTGLKELVIPTGVTEISDQVFKDCTALRKVVIDDTVTDMGTYIFENCSSLQEVKLPGSRINITEGTFLNCTALTSITLPETVTYIRARAFEGSGLKEIVLPQNVELIEESAFRYADQLEQIVIPDAVQEMQREAFHGCTSLKTVSFGKGLKTIGQGAFFDCDSLTEITVPDTVTTMDAQTFENCDNLETVILGTGITNIPKQAFRLDSKLKTVQLPYATSAIEEKAFSECVSLQEIAISRAVETIDDNAFSYPDKLTIYGINGSYAQEYAKEQNIKFVNREILAETVSLSQEEMQLLDGREDRLLLQVTPSDFTDAVTWKSSDENVVTVDAIGNIQTKNPGTATIKVNVGEKSVTCQVTVLQSVERIWLNESRLNMEALSSFRLQADIYPDSAADKSVLWSSSDETVATVDQNGTVTAVSKGSAEIRVSALDGSGKYATCQIAVENDAHVVTSIEELQCAHPYENDCHDFWLYTIEGAEKLSVSFDEKTEMEDGFDYLYVYDKNGDEVGKYTGTELSGKTIIVEGDTVKIKLDTDDGGNAYGFKVTEVTKVGDTPTPSETAKPTETPTPTPSETAKPTETPTPTPSETAKPTETPTPKPSETVKPTAIPSPKPGETVKPTETPNATPTSKPDETPNPGETGTSAPAPETDFTAKETDTGVSVEKYIGTDATVVVPDQIAGKPVTEIGANAFAETAVEEIMLPESVTSIGAGAFANCGSLKSVTITAAETVIAGDAFKGCENVTIRCFPNSSAKQYAQSLGISFELIYYYGDVDMDGEIKATDALNILKHVVQLVTISDETALQLADVSHDGDVLAADALGVLKVVVNLQEKELYKK